MMLNRAQRLCHPMVQLYGLESQTTTATAHQPMVEQSCSYGMHHGLWIVLLIMPLLGGICIVLRGTILSRTQYGWLWPCRENVARLAWSRKSICNWNASHRYPYFLVTMSIRHNPSFITIMTTPVPNNPPRSPGNWFVNYTRVVGGVFQSPNGRRTSGRQSRPR